MLKYGREVNGRLVDIVAVPDNVDPAAWLDVMFAPMKEVWAAEWFRPVTEEEYQASLPPTPAHSESDEDSLATIKTKLAEIQAMVNAL